MSPRLLYVLTVLAALWGCASSPDLGTAAFWHQRNLDHGHGPSFPADAERSRWVTRSGAGRD